jgi:hypothetical protein
VGALAVWQQQTMNHSDKLPITKRSTAISIQSKTEGKISVSFQVSAQISRMYYFIQPIVLDSAQALFAIITKALCAKAGSYT